MSAAYIVLTQQAVKCKHFRFSAVAACDAVSGSAAYLGAKGRALIDQLDAQENSFRGAGKYEAVDAVGDKVAVSCIASRNDRATNRHRFQNCAAHALALRSVGDA